MEPRSVRRCSKWFQSVGRTHRGHEVGDVRPVLDLLEGLQIRQATTAVVIVVAVLLVPHYVRNLVTGLARRGFVSEDLRVKLAVLDLLISLQECLRVALAQRAPLALLLELESGDISGRVNLKSLKSSQRPAYRDRP